MMASQEPARPLLGRTADIDAEESSLWESRIRNGDNELSWLQTSV